MAKTAKDNGGRLHKYATLEEVRASVREEERFKSLTPLQQATHLLMEKICALNMGVMDTLVGCDLRDVLRIVAEDLKIHIDQFLAALQDEHAGARRR